MSLERRGQVVTREELQEKLQDTRSPGRFCRESSLHRNCAQARISLHRAHRRGRSRHSCAARQERIDSGEVCLGSSGAFPGGSEHAVAVSFRRLSRAGSVAAYFASSPAEYLVIALQLCRFARRYAPGIRYGGSRQQECIVDSCAVCERRSAVGWYRGRLPSFLVAR